MSHDTVGRVCELWYSGCGAVSCGSGDCGPVSCGVWWLWSCELWYNGYGAGSCDALPLWFFTCKLEGDGKRQEQACMAGASQG